MDSFAKHEKSGNLFFNALNQIPDIILILSREGSISFANESAQNAFNLSTNEFQKLSLQELNFGILNSELINIDYLKKDVRHGIKSFLLEVRPITEDNENLLIICHEKKRANTEEPNLIEEFKLLKKAQKVAKLGSWIWDTKNGTVKWSDALFEIFDMDPTPGNQLSAKNYYNFVHPEDGNKLKSENVIEKPDGTKGFEYRVITSTGNIKHVFNTEGQPLGEPNMLFGILLDVTDLRENERQLIQTKEILRENLKRENILAQISITFNSLEQLESKVKQSLAFIGSYTNCCRAYIFEDSVDAPISIYKFEWCNTGIQPIMNDLKVIHYEMHPSLDKVFAKDGRIQTSNISSLPKDIISIFKPRKIKSILALPLISGKKKIGFIGFDYHIKKKDWKEEEILLLKTLSNIIADAFQQKRMEEALITREAELREVQKITLTSKFEVNLIDQKVFVSEEFSKMSGLEPGWQPSENFSSIIHEADREDTEVKFAHALKEKSEFLATYRIIHKKSGEEKYFTSKGFIQYDDSGKPTRYLGTKQDVTHSMLQKLKIKETNSQLENIINNVPGAVYQRKANDYRKVKFLNGHAKDLLGYDTSDFAPEGHIHFFDLVYENERGILKKQISDSIKNHSAYEVSYRVKDKHNNEKWIWDRGSFVMIGNEKYIQGILVDITHRIKVEDRIISATMQAEDAERKRISKEINDGVQQTLVSSMLSLQSLEPYIDQSDDPKIKDRYKGGLEMLKSGVSETRSIAYNIMPKSIQDFGLIKTLESMIQLLNESSSIHFYFYNNLKSERLSERTETSLYRICREGINNILNFSEASEASIQVMKHENNVSLTIEDNGKGFDTKKVDLFYTGFGISSMKSRANAIGGSFEIESRVGMGTNILVNIPDYKKD